MNEQVRQTSRFFFAISVMRIRWKVPDTSHYSIVFCHEWWYTLIARKYRDIHGIHSPRYQLQDARDVQRAASAVGRHIHIAEWPVIGSRKVENW